MLKFSWKSSPLLFAIAAAALVGSMGPNSVAGVFPQRDYDAIDQVIRGAPKMLLPSSRSRIRDNEIRGLMDYTISQREQIDGSKQATEQFLALDDMRHPEKRCTKEMHRIVQANVEQCLDGRLIDLIIMHFKQLHADLCKTYFVERYESRVMSAGKDVVFLVENVLDTLLAFYIGNFGNTDGAMFHDAALLSEATMRNAETMSNDAIVNIFSQVGRDSGAAIGCRYHTELLMIGILTNVEQDEQAVKWLKGKVEVTDIERCVEELSYVFHKYVVKPCQIFVNVLGHDFFDLSEQIGGGMSADFGPASSSQHPNFELLAKYFGAWARFKTCRELIRYGAYQMAKDAFEIKSASGAHH